MEDMTKNILISLNNMGKDGISHCRLAKFRQETNLPQPPLSSSG